MGEEIIYKDDKACWGMNYYGYVNEPSLSTKEVYDFLKKALLQTIESDLLPVRGPAYFSEGDWEYQNRLLQQEDLFIGEEQIYFKNKIAYICHYHGGSIE